jgi:hypothetical protein
VFSATKAETQAQSREVAQIVQQPNRPQASLPTPHALPASASRLIDLLAEQTRLAMHFFAFYPVDRSIERGVGKLGIERRLFLIPLGQLPFPAARFP